MKSSALKKGKYTWLSENHKYTIEKQDLVICEVCFKAIRAEIYAQCSCGDRMHKSCIKTHKNNKYIDTL